MHKSACLSVWACISPLQPTHSQTERETAWGWLERWPGTTVVRVFTHVGIQTVQYLHISLQPELTVARDWAALAIEDCTQHALISSQYWDGILGYQFNKRLESYALCYSVFHSPFSWRILKKNILFSGFKNPYKKYSSLFMNNIW